MTTGAALRDGTTRVLGPFVESRQPSAIALREAVCIFRIATNTIRRPKPDWNNNTVAGIALANEVLG